MLPEQLGYISVLLSLIGVFFYIRAMFYGQVKPNRISWIIWMIAPFIGTWLQLKAGAGFSVIPVFMAGFGPLLILIASFVSKNGYWKISMLDIICGVLSAFALILWVATHRFSLSILFAIFADALAIFPTIIKAWKHPETENWLIYGQGIVSNTIGLLIIKTWSFPIYSFSVYLILANIIMVICLYRKNIFKTLIVS